MLSTLLAIVILNNQPQPKLITPGNNVARKCSRPGGGRACEPRLAEFVPDPSNPPKTTFGSGTRKSLG